MIREETSETDTIFIFCCSTNFLPSFSHSNFNLFPPEVEQIVETRSPSFALLGKVNGCIFHGSKNENLKDKLLK